ncbi:MAG: hypothetical protein MUQ10_12980 [Anaerolineae bacterium]|nr:hypothetical protein [Anaerolineae bacterium]
MAEAPSEHLYLTTVYGPEAMPEAILVPEEALTDGYQKASPSAVYIVVVESSRRKS